ncbi:cupin domain-containing protein [Granulicella sp. 5B5]|uniref:cupin domain-containing protein n=1 Tax=Granulicella sp. 5B5 TaxID=1617967 RepID=UPI0015F4F80D|nr:cupin domain-containing protein [Granulicella sp. 5B5]
MSDAKAGSIQVVRPEEQSAGTAQTSGSQRMAAVSRAQGIETGMWAGTFLVEPGAKTGIHHHGEQETVVYVLEGEALVKWGERGGESATVRAGDFVHVPAWVVHQEINPSATEAFRWVVVRSTPEPIVVNLPDAVWE